METAFIHGHQSQVEVREGSERPAESFPPLLLQRGEALISSQTYLKLLDSRLRGNDINKRNWIFYEAVNFESTLIIVSTSQVMRVFKKPVDCNTQSKLYDTFSQTNRLRQSSFSYDG